MSAYESFRAHSVWSLMFFPYFSVVGDAAKFVLLCLRV